MLHTIPSHLIASMKSMLNIITMIAGSNNVVVHNVQFWLLTTRFLIQTDFRVYSTLQWLAVLPRCVPKPRVKKHTLQLFVLFDYVVTHRCKWHTTHIPMWCQQIGPTHVCVITLCCSALIRRRAFQNMHLVRLEPHLYTSKLCILKMTYFGELICHRHCHPAPENRAYTRRKRLQ
jgi:hypothetical protein